MSIPISEIIREIKHNVSMRLDILESLLSRVEHKESTSDNTAISKRIGQMETKLDTLFELLKTNEKRFTVDLMESDTPILHINEEYEEPIKICVSHMDEEEESIKDDEEESIIEEVVDEIIEEKEEEIVKEVVDEIVKKVVDEIVKEEEEVVEEIVEEEEEIVEEVVEEVEEKEEIVEEVEEKEEEEEEEEEEVEEKEEEEEEKEEEEEEKEEEEEAIELTEFIYKGLTLYRDSDAYVYQLDSEGSLIDTPIGIWDDVKQRIKKLQ